MATVVLASTANGQAARERARISVRPITAADVQRCGEIAFAAHSEVAAAHNVPCEHPSLQFSVGLIGAKVKDDNASGFVAEQSGRILGTVFLNRFPATPAAAVGPLTVDPAAGIGGVGRLLMEATLEAARAQAIERVRLVQSPSHLRSLALYSRLGFTVREPLVLMNGPVAAATSATVAVRKAVSDDIAACEQLCAASHGFSRGFELRAAIEEQVATVAVRGGRTVGYAAGIGFRGHAVAETTDDLKALIAHAPVILGPGFFVPLRNGELLRWLFDNGFRASWPAALMTKGPYQEPATAFLPSIAF